MTDAPLHLVLPDGTRLPVVDEIAIGRAPGNSLQISHPTVSRHHARVIWSDEDEARIEDTGSSHGTYVDGWRVTDKRRLQHGSRIRVGDIEIVVDAEPARTSGFAPKSADTIVVEAALDVDQDWFGNEAAGVKVESSDFDGNPKMRPGYALKKLDDAHERDSWVLRDLASDAFMRLSDDDAELLLLLDGNSSLVELIREAERRFGRSGPVRLARLLADLGERGLLAGIAQSTPAPARRVSFFARLFRPRSWAFTGLGDWFGRSYSRWGFRLFNRPALTIIGIAAAGGVVVFGYLVLARYGTPFVVGQKVGLGALIFLLGRLALVSIHELAHGLTMASFGRKVRRAGLKLVLIFPFAFVDTSEAWFESKRRRIAVSAAGPVADLTMAAIFSFSCFLLESGTVRDICFQLAFASYVGAVFNLNPLMDRDGYHMLVDRLGEPNLRQRAREHLRQRLAGGRPSRPSSPVLTKYFFAATTWSVVIAACAVLFSLHYVPTLSKLIPAAILWGLVAAFWVALLAPLMIDVVHPLATRLRNRSRHAAGKA